MLTLITLHFAAWIKARRDRAALRELLAKEDRVLDDMGLARFEVEQAMGLPYRFNIAEAARNMSRHSLGLDQRL
ncbi:MAG: hypothetical protein AAFR17_10895 [Pseudomonadota bacterium]